MAASSQSGSEDEISGINVVPLVDIMLVLVIILMVTAEFSRYRTIPIRLPNINAASMKSEPQKVNLTLKQDGRIFWNDKPLPSQEVLTARLQAQKQVQPQLAVILRAEGTVRYEDILKLLDRVKEAGVVKVGLAVGTKDGPSK